MLSFTGSLKIYVAVEGCDMRKSFEGLQALVATALDRDIRDGALFVFSNRRRTRLKVIYWDGTGLWVMAMHSMRLRDHGVAASLARIGKGIENHRKEQKGVRG